MKSSPRDLLRTWQGPHDYVPAGGHRGKDLPAHRPKATTYEVAGNRAAHGLGHDKAKTARLRAGPFEHVKHRCGRTDPASTTNRGAEVVGTSHPVRPGEHAEVLRGQFGATLAATSTQDGAAGAGAHAEAETVNLRAAAVVRLESSLAHSGISKAQL